MSSARYAFALITASILTLATPAIAQEKAAKSVTLEQMVHPGAIGVTRMVQLFTTGPARILRIDRGTLAKDAAGDVTIFSMDREWTYDVNKSFSKSRNSPFDGKSFKGGPVATVVAGEVVWKV